MSNWIKAFNPTAPIATEAEAVNAARASAIAIFLGVVLGLVGVAVLMNGGMAAVSDAMAQQAGGDPAVAGMAGAMTSMIIGMAVVMIVAQLILGLVQWFKPNIVIPILFIVFVVYGLGSGLLGQVMAGQMEVPETPMNAPWMQALNYVVLVIQLILHVSGVRGASALSKFRAAQAY